MAILHLGSLCSAVIPVLVLLQCTSTVFTQSPTPSPETCEAYVDSGDCRFYSECVESRIPCGAGGYTLGYGLNYCNRFDQHRDKFNDEGRQWIDSVRPCLMREIRRSNLYSSPTGGDSDCDNLRILAFNSHPTCYVRHGFCSIVTSLSNLNGLFFALQFGRDFVGPYWRESWAQVGETFTRCCSADESFKSTLRFSSNSQQTFIFQELHDLYCDPCENLPDATAVNSSVVFLLDASGSIGSAAFTTMIFSVASAAVTLAETGTRVGVVVFSDFASVDVPLQIWEDPDLLRISIEGIRYDSGGTNTHNGINTATSVLGEEGIRVILLLTDGQSNNRRAAENAADAAKQKGIRIYSGGIGDSINEDELNSLASYPPEEYRISIEDFTETALNEELQPLIASTCLTPEQILSGQQQEGVLEEGQVRSLQYDLPEDGLTISANVNGEANMYMSYTIRNPTFVTADFITGGSGQLSFYVPPLNGSMKRQANEDESNVFVSVIAKKNNTVLTLNTTDGNTFIQRVPGAPVNFTHVNYTSQESYFVWNQPLLTNGIITEYTLLCIPGRSMSPNCMKRVNSSLYQADQQYTTVLNCLELDEGVIYNCRLNASNDAGYGPAVSIQVSSTDAVSAKPIIFIVSIIFGLYNFVQNV